MTRRPATLERPSPLRFTQVSPPSVVRNRSPKTLAWSRRPLDGATARSQESNRGSRCSAGIQLLALVRALEEAARLEAHVDRRRSPARDDDAADVPAFRPAAAACRLLARRHDGRGRRPTGRTRQARAPARARVPARVRAVARARQASSGMTLFASPPSRTVIAPSASPRKRPPVVHFREALGRAACDELVCAHRRLPESCQRRRRRRACRAVAARSASPPRYFMMPMKTRISSSTRMRTIVSSSRFARDICVCSTENR